MIEIDCKLTDSIGSLQSEPGVLYRDSRLQAFTTALGRR